MRGYCPECKRMVNVREINGITVHTHRIETAWFGFLQEHHRTYRNEIEHRTIMARVSYYDLIELPSGGHIPVPIAIGLIGRENICRIPIDRKRKRDDWFFICPVCSFGGPISRSFFRCKVHSTKDEEEYNRTKERELAEIIKAKQYRRLKYIRSVR
jgi:hypothetical protein